MNNISREEFYNLNPHHKTADVTIGALYLLCFAYGVPSNILSFYFFTRRRLKSMDIPTFLYTLTALNDSLTSILVLNNGITMLRNREVFLPAFCAAQHILFQMTQRMSVFLVATLSTTRTYSLVFPLRRIGVISIQIISVVFWTIMTCFFVLPPLLNLVRITYHFEGGYCWADAIPGKNISITWDKLDNALDTIGLAFPVVPIAVSCIISTCKILDSRKIKSNLTARRLSTRTMKRCSMSGKKSYHRATCTIILVTVFYLITNLPLFLNYVFYLITILSFEWPGPIYDDIVMYFYSWNLTAILSTGLNASINPIIYLTRFKQYRKWVTNGCSTNKLLEHNSSNVSGVVNSKARTAVYSINSNSGSVRFRFKENRFARKLESKILTSEPCFFNNLESEGVAISSGELVTES